MRGALLSANDHQTLWLCIAGDENQGVVRNPARCRLELVSIGDPRARLGAGIAASRSNIRLSGMRLRLS